MYGMYMLLSISKPIIMTYMVLIDQVPPCVREKCWTANAI